ncbi:TRAP transporter large permease [Chloroflexota bacterium]
MEFLGIAALVLLLVAGAPIFIAVFVAVAIIVVFALGIDPIVVWSVMFDKVNSLVLIAVPMFILSGQLLHVGGAARPLVNLLNTFMGHIPGGPAYAVVVACVLFAAMSSSTMAAVAGVAPVMTPILMQCGYSKRFSIGLILASSSMAGIIPPSIGLILYGFITETSVLALWTAAIIPGLVQATLIMLTVWIHSRRGHFTSLPKASWGDRWRALKEGWPVLIMPVIVLGPLYGGIATPSEVGSIAAVYSLFLGVVVYKGLKLRELWQASYKTVSILAAVFAIIIGALLLSTALVYVRIPYRLTESLANMGLNWAGFMAVMLVAYLVMGAFLDSSSILLISVPILLPTIVSLNINPVMYGIFTENCVEIAIITPPYGLLLFASAGILRENFSFVARSVLLFYPALIIHPILIAYIPQMSLWLPNLLGY